LPAAISIFTIPYNSGQEYVQQGLPSIASLAALLLLAAGNGVELPI